MSELSNITDLGDLEHKQELQVTSVHVRAPRRILHFSDGTMEEYSTDDELDAFNDGNDDKNKQLDVSRHLEWGPWMIQRILYGGNRMLAACDFAGEKIAAALGITTPKYSYEIEQFKKIQQERLKAKEEENSVGGWMQETNDDHMKTNYVKTETNHIEHIITQPNVEKF